MKIVYFLIFSILLGGITLNVYGESIDEMHETAFNLMKKGDFVEAIDMYTTILKLDTKDEKALLNRAAAYSQIGNSESSILDFSTILENNPKNISAIKGKASILSNFECKSYNDCGPLEALHLFERALEIRPNDEELQMKKNFLLTLVKPFDVRDTNGDYMINIQLITRDKNGSLVSVIENSGTDVFPSKLLENYVDNKEKSSTNFKKEFVSVGGDKYIKWYYEINTSEKNRKFFGAIIFDEIIIAKTPEGDNLRIKMELLRSIIPAQNVDEGDTTLQIFEMFKKI
tara:strand:+ start:60 stop:917 length:858 start_codon:yes stop_codon:yes gene_type:complete